MLAYLSVLRSICLCLVCHIFKWMCVRQTYTYCKMFTLKHTHTQTHTHTHTHIHTHTHKHTHTHTHAHPYILAL